MGNDSYGKSSSRVNIKFVKKSKISIKGLSSVSKEQVQQDL